MSVLDKFKLVELVSTRTDATATFVSGNSIKFNTATMADLEFPEYIQLFVYEKGKQFAIKVCKKEDQQALKFSKPAGEQKYPIKVTCAPVCSVIRKMMNWETDQCMHVPGAIFRDEGVIIFPLEQAYEPDERGGWAAKKKASEASASVSISTDNE